MAKILIVEDEFAISQVVKAYLEKHQYSVAQCFTGTDAVEMFEKERPQLVLLDVMLPGKNGWTILREIRERSECPVIMLTALGEIDNRLEGFEKGADDYIPKPFNGEEVVARVKAVLKRSKIEGNSKKTFGCMQIDFDGHAVYLDGKLIDLTPRDLSLLLFLAEHPNKTFTRDQLIEYVWGWEYEGSDRAVDLAVKRLRKALANWPAKDGEIRTLRGLGYQFHVTSY